MKRTKQSTKCAILSGIWVFEKRRVRAHCTGLSLEIHCAYKTLLLFTYAVWTLVHTIVLMYFAKNQNIINTRTERTKEWSVERENEHREKNYVLDNFHWIWAHTKWAKLTFRHWISNIKMHNFPPPTHQIGQICSLFFLFSDGKIIKYPLPSFSKLNFSSLCFADVHCAAIFAHKWISFVHQQHKTEYMVGFWVGWCAA